LIKIGIVGHRFFVTHQVGAFVSQQCKLILERIQVNNRRVTALSAIAEGADSLFAGAALSLKIPLEIVRPFDKYISDFLSEDSRSIYLELRKAALRETRLPYLARSEEAYFAAMTHIVSNSDLLVAVWDGTPSNGRGGTAQAVKLAIESYQNWIHVNVHDLSVKFYLRKSH
jgi:hypothetical protein